MCLPTILPPCSLHTQAVVCFLQKFLYCQWQEQGGEGCRRDVLPHSTGPSREQVVTQHTRTLPELQLLHAAQAISMFYVIALG